MLVDGAEVFDATGLIVEPGFVDLRVHLREPGEEYKEKLASGALRGEEDRAALIEGVRDGTIDEIATDHAPHHSDEKMLEYDRAAFRSGGT